MQGNVVKVGGTCKNLLDSLCMINVQNGPMETVILNTCGWVNLWCMLDWILEFGQKTAEIHFFGMRAQLVSAQDDTLL